MTYRVIVTDSALERIREYAVYIAVDQQAPEAAARWLERVLDACDTLSEVPRRCALAAENEHTPYEVRWRAVGEFQLLFTVLDKDSTVYVIGARHGRRLPRPDELSPEAGVGDGDPVRDTRGMLAGTTSLTEALLEERRRDREREDR